MIKGKNKFILKFSILLLIMPLIIPSSIIKDKQLHRCKDCGIVRKINIYYVDFTILIPGFSFSDKNITQKKIPEGHDWEISKGNNLSNIKLPGKIGRYISISIAFFLLFYTFIFKRYFLFSFSILGILGKQKGSRLIYKVAIMMFVFIAAMGLFFIYYKKIVQEIASIKGSKNGIMTNSVIKKQIQKSNLFKDVFDKTKQMVPDEVFDKAMGHLDKYDNYQNEFNKLTNILDNKNTRENMDDR